MSGNTLACPMKPSISINSASSTAQIKMVIKLLGKKWMMLTIFIIITLFFGYLIYINIISIIDSFNKYKQHVYDKASSSPNPTARIVQYTPDDDEVYDGLSKIEKHKLRSTSMVDNSTIIKSMETIKSDYKPYNDLLKQYNPKSQDKVDEKIMSSEYDNY
jgi:hypothetical protein